MTIQDYSKKTVEFFNKKSVRLALDILFPICLVIYSVILVNQGVTVTDTGYNYGNYINFSTLDPMWKFSTFLATFIGNIFTHLPLGTTLLGLNIYTGLVKALIAVSTYFICVYGLKMNRSLMFLSQMMALGYCWCPTSLLYNYLTYLFFTLGGLLLCLAVKYEKNCLYIIAGIFLGANVLVRFPNIVECLLIIALWVYCIMKRIKFKDALIRTLLCIGGYIIGALLILGPIAIIYGPSNYITGIQQILAMSSEADGYSVKYMLIGDARAYLENMKWVLLSLIPVMIGTAIYLISGKKYMWIKRLVMVLASLALIPLFLKLHMFGFIYYAYDSMYFVGIFFLIIAGLMGLYVAFISKASLDLKMMAMIMGLIILITPLGSNNYLFSAENNLFIVTPFVFHCLFLLFTEGKKYLDKKEKISLEPLKITLLIMVLFTFIQGILFGGTFVFRDGTAGEKRTAVIENNEVLKGMHTNEKNGAFLNELNSYLDKNQLKGSDVILYGDVPALAFYMDLNPVMSSTWPDLASFSVNKFETEISEIDSKVKESGSKPLVILGHELNTDYPKHVVLSNFLKDNQYEETFTYDYVLADDSVITYHIYQ